MSGWFICWNSDNYFARLSFILWVSRNEEKQQHHKIYKSITLTWRNVFIFLFYFSADTQIDCVNTNNIVFNFKYNSIFKWSFKDLFSSLFLNEWTIMMKISWRKFNKNWELNESLLTDETDFLHGIGIFGWNVKCDGGVFFLYLKKCSNDRKNFSLLKISNFNVKRFFDLNWTLVRLCQKKWSLKAFVKPFNHKKKYS